MSRLREGLDKVTLTVREKDFDPKKYPYPKPIAIQWGDRIQKLKFTDRYADTILFEKYLWQTWKSNNQERSSWGTQYYLRLDGMRQMRVVLNCQRLYNTLHGLKVYDKRLFDDNVVVPSVDYYLEEFVEIVQKQIYEIINDYIGLRKRIFNDTVIHDDLVVDTHQIEMVREGIGLHTSDVSDIFRRYSQCETITVYHEHTNTHYFNTPQKRQLKMYQKGVGILRLEATFNTRPNELVYSWLSDDIVTTANSLRTEFNILMRHVGLPELWYEQIILGKKNFVWRLAEAINLRGPSKEEDEEERPIDSDLLLILLSLNSWASDTHNRKLTYYLKRKGLLQHSGRRGIWIPTDRLMFLKDIFWHFCDKEEWSC